MLKAKFIRALSLGLKPGLSEGKKLSIQIATLDAYWSLTTIAFYIITALIRDFHPLLYVHCASFFLISIGTVLLWKHHYDVARFMIHFVCLGELFLTADAYGANSGVENFYFTSIAIPFVTFSLEERWKGNIQVIMASLVLITQQTIGSNHFLPTIEILPGDKITAIIVVISYFLLIFGVVRRQVRLGQMEVAQKQKDLIHSSNMIVLGEMSATVAHEINNPLQSLSLQTSVLRERLTERDVDLRLVDAHLVKMEDTILRVGKLVHGLKKLSESKTAPSIETFQFMKLLDNVLDTSAERFHAYGTKLFINGDTSKEIKGHSSQIGDVLMKLLHDAGEAVKNQDEKWIRIEVTEKNSFLQISVSNPGKGDSYEASGHVLKNVIEKNNGSLYYDDSGSHSKYVMLLPLG